MAQSIIQSSFSAGEISQNLWARVDLDKYHTGAAVMKNFFVDYRGGASSRQGTLLVDRTYIASRKARLIPFIVSQQQSYAIELGHLYMRFISNGAVVLEASKTIAAASQTNPCELQITAHGYTSGDDIFIAGCAGMTELNGWTFAVTVIDVDHITLSDLDGHPIDASTYTAYTGGGTASRVYTLASPYTESELPLVKYTQSADVLTLVHPNHGIMNLSRTGPSTFTLSAEVIGETLPAPGAPTVTATVVGALVYGYQIVAVSATGDKSLPSVTTAVSSAALNPTPATGSAALVDITWTAVPNTDHYDIYKFGPIDGAATWPSVLGYIGTARTTNFTDNNIAPNFALNPPSFHNPFTSGNNPGCVTYFQQRRWYGNLVNNPEELDASQTGSYSNFDVSLFVLDSDAIQVSLASRQVNAIKSMVPMASGLVILTTGGAFQVSGGGAATAVTPNQIVALPQASTGANDLQPIVVNYDILYVQAKGSIVRDLAYNFYIQTFYGFDRSALSNHLFFGYTLVDWTWCEEPFKIVWAVRNDGRLLSLTYMPEQEVYGWAQHETQGLVESVCSVPEGQEDVLYLIVRRFLDGVGLVRYIERQQTRKWVRVEDVWCVDCGLNIVLPRPNYGLDCVVTGTTATFTAEGVTPFDSTFIGKTIWLDAGGQALITTVISSSVIEATVLEPLGNQIPETPYYANIVAGSWELGSPVTTVSGLNHLKNQKVAVLADGQAGSKTVSASGTIMLDAPASKVTVGLGFTAQLQTLYLDTGEPTTQGKRKQIAACTVRMDQTRGLKIGQSFDDLVQYKEFGATGLVSGAPIPLYHGDERVVISEGWNTYAQICCQQDYPLPATILGIIPEVTFGDNAT